MTRLLQLAVLIAGLLLQGTAPAQTCSCAAVPILGAMESASPKKGDWYLAATYEYHDISDLVQGSSTVHDDTGRDRTSEALVVEASRGLVDKWSVSVLASVVRHERDVGGDRDTAAGLGDALAMVKYSPKAISLYDRSTVSFGLGARIPAGRDDAADDSVVLAEDMQPSTGAWAAVGWVYAARAFTDSRSARLYLTAAYTLNGENGREYQFGHSATASIGGSYQSRSPWGWSVELAYRHAERDRRDGVSIPNTGGSWLDIVPAVQYHLTDSVALNAAAKIPLARDLNDELQFTTRYAVRLSVAWVFGRS